MPTFHFDLPVYVTVDREANNATGLPRALRLAEYDDRGIVFPVFTDEMIAERYLAESGITGAEAKLIESPDELIGLAEEVQRVGITLAAFDITIRPKGHRFLVTLTDLIDFLS